jgi:hypothetical protein
MSRVMAWKRMLVGAIAMMGLLALGTTAQVQGAEPRMGLAGYDPVAYFTTPDAPLKGSPDLTFDYDETRYRFASAENRTLFAGNPDKYAPRYNGYCAMNMSKGTKLEADPHNWTIIDGQLYVFGAPPDRAKLNQNKEWIGRGQAEWSKIK